MGRGLGARQKVILAALSDGQSLSIRELGGKTPAGYRATLRAAHRLSDAGLIVLTWQANRLYAKTRTRMGTVNT